MKRSPAKGSFFVTNALKSLFIPQPRNLGKENPSRQPPL